MSNVTEVPGIRMFAVNTEFGIAHVYVCPAEDDRGDHYNGYLYSHTVSEDGSSVDDHCEEFMAVVHALVDEPSDDGNIFFDILKALPL